MWNREKIEENLKEIKNKLVVMSGKGGVGKSTLSLNLSLAFLKKGYSVGLLDSDFHGPTIPKLLGIEDLRPEIQQNKILPIEVEKNFKVLSMALFLKSKDQAVVWRGPLKFSATRQFLEDVLWGNLDFLIIDLPPGTGDEPLTIAQLISPPVHSIIVTTPQEVALTSVRKSVNFAKLLKMNLLGIIENMSGLSCPHCGKEIPFFKKGGGEALANKFNLKYLGTVPFDLDLVNCSDDGKYLIYLDEKAPSSLAFYEISKKILELL